MTRKKCVDCPPGVRRKAPYPGPRCATHHRAIRATRARDRHAARILRVYGITRAEYDAIKRAQGDVCYICARATGAQRNLAVDHDHTTGYVRGLLCKTCNYRVLGHLRDDKQALERAIQYLENPPAFGVIGRRKVPDHDD